MLNYKLKKMKLFKKGFYILLLLFLSITISCNEDDDLNIIAGLDFVTATLNAKGNKVGVVPSTIPPDGRIVYTVDFGDPTGSEDEVIQQTSGPMVTYSYPIDESATYLITVTASLPGRSDVSITKEHTVIIATDEPTDGETGTLIFDDFEGNGNIDPWFADGIIVNTSLANPVSGGINTSATVLEYNDDGSGQYANLRFDVDSNFDLSEDNTFTLKIYVESSSITGAQTNQISLKLQDGTFGNPWETQTEIIKPLVLDQWQEIIFDFANDDYVNWATITDAPVDRTDLNRVVLQLNSENNSDAVRAYIDDFSYGSGSVAAPTTYADDDFEGTDGITTWFADGVILNTSLANPVSGGINTSATVLEYNDDGSGQYANIRFDVDPNFDLSVENKFTLKIYVESSSITGAQTNQISLKLQDGTFGNPWETQTEIIKPLALDQWQEITFDFANDDYVNWATITDAPVDRTDLSRVVLQLNSENNSDAVKAYIDDITYHE